MEATTTVAPRAKLSRVAVFAVGLVAALCASTPAQATQNSTGTITATAGGTRSATNTDGGYAAPLAGLAFQKAPWVSNPDSASWSALCTTGGSGACTSASMANGRYLVRESPTGAPAGWRALTRAAWSGASTGASPSRAYVGDVTVSGANATVRPSTSWSPTAATPTSGAFVAARNNPPLPDRCGLDVLLLLDRSGSIAPQKDTYKAAAEQFVSSLSGTPTRLKISSFASDTTANQASFLNLDTTADVATANAKIGDVYSAPAGSTNWDGGMNLAASAGVDVVVFITDGNPTYRNTPTGGSSGGLVDLLDLTAGVASANKVKTIGKSAGAGATILAVGAGTGVTAGNLSAVSGPDEGDDYVTSSIDGLGAKLQEIANKLCGARIHVRQLTDDGDSASPKAGWTFTPGKPSGSPVTLAPAAVTTAGSPAEAAITVDKVPAGGASAITVTETQKAGYVFVASECRLGGFADVTSGGAVTATIATVRRTRTGTAPSAPASSWAASPSRRPAMPGPTTATR
jgi:von Willebrand factor type A domain